MTIALKQSFLGRILVLVVISFCCIANAQNLDLETDAILSSNLPVMSLLKFAFNLNGGSDDQVIGVPSWVSSLPFDIRAKVDEEAAARIAEMSTDDRIATMRKVVQMLLADRFQLKVHHESRELRVLALMIAKGGSKLTAISDMAANCDRSG
jgi:uncharacterized protein (TIGR03435 family)